MPPHGEDALARLEAERDRLHWQLAAVGDFRRGSLNRAYRRCGRRDCACADPVHPRHGPVNLLTKSVAGKTVTRAVPAGPPLAKVQREVARYQRFKAIVGQIVAVNELLCETRPVADPMVAHPDADRGGIARPSRPTSDAR